VAAPVAALAGTIAVEIDTRAEALLDARAVRRLVQIELADVNVPPRPGDQNTALFVRVLAGREGELRVELWERGESHGARSVAAGRGSNALTARRVALAAAELARGLRQRRIVLARAADREKKRKAALERLERDRTLDGPHALRFGASGTFAEELVLVGPVLDAELHVYGRTRLDLGAGWSFGSLGGESALEAWSVRGGPARRLVLGSRVDLDLGLRAEASVLSFQKALAVDGMRGQEESWAARLEGVVRLQPRFTRSLRLSVGPLFGVTLRRPNVEPFGGGSLTPGRLYAGAELALVLTPEGAR
jgi:hypothetical protein